MTDIGERLRGAAPKPPAKPSPLPDGCPVTPLGLLNMHCWYLSARGELVSLNPTAHGRNHLAILFSPKVGFLKEKWPRTGKDGMPTGQFRPEAVADALIQACGERGVWSPDAKVRGRGAWTGRDDDLILHLGDCLYVRGRKEPCGLRDELVYPVLPARPHPAESWQPGGDDGPAVELLDLLRTWSWRRPAIDPRLLLGWICAAMVGGALPWRPAAWLTGDRGTGKSTLQDLLARLFVDGQGILQAADTTAAGLRSRVRQDSLPVALDEVEADADSSKALELVQLARLASSGGTLYRGGADQQGHSFTIRFATLYSSILMPPMRGQDLSRIAVLNLLPLDRAARPPKLDPEELGTLGRRLLRRMADVWDGLAKGEAGLLARWQRALRERGFDHRGAEQMGVLLACADAALSDEATSDDTIGCLCDQLVASQRGERADELADWQLCLGHLASSMAGHWRHGEQRTVGTLVAIAAGRPIGDRLVERLEATGEALPTAALPTPEQSAEANDLLATIGVRVDGEVVMIANDHQGLARIFDGTHWASRSGATGVWRQALLRVPGASASATSVRFRGPKKRAVLVPVGRLLGDET